MEAKATKVTKTEQHADSQGIHLVCRGRLILIENNDITEDSIIKYINYLIDGCRISIPNNEVTFLNPLDKKLITIKGINRFKSVKPIIISETEEIEVGDKYLVELRSNTSAWQQLVIEAKSFNTHSWEENKDNNVVRKILALPEQFSSKQLQAIVDGKLKDGDEVLVECEEEQRWITPTGMYGEGYYKGLGRYNIKLTKDNHIKLFPAKKERIQTSFDCPDIEAILAGEESWEELDAHIRRAYNMAMGRLGTVDYNIFKQEYLMQNYYPPKRK